MELTVPGELAGVSGPCPQCGGLIQSPPPFAGAVEESLSVVSDPEVRELPEENPPVVPQARPQKVRAELPSGLPMARSQEPLPSSRPAEPRSRTRTRTIDPSSCLSSKYDDQKEQGAVIRVALAVLVTVGIVAAVFFLFPEG
jgi:hypothetical protein